jgi:hypothetical protein
MVSETFQPHINDGFALIDTVETKAGKTLLHSMKILLPEGSVTAILGPSGESFFGYFDRVFLWQSC